MIALQITMTTERTLRSIIICVIRWKIARGFDDASEEHKINFTNSGLILDVLDRNV